MNWKHRGFTGVLFAFFVTVGLFLSNPCFGVTNPCPPFYLKTDQGQIINPMTGENADQPFSTRQTCGSCHDVDTISKGYHFMMDWDKAQDDLFKDTQTPWQVSTGLTGKLITYGFYQLAKKHNTHPDEIDLSVFDFIAQGPPASKDFQKPGCAGCHPGGGLMEFDRDGFRYDTRLAENPKLAQTLDGDYYNSQWDKTGVIEPDCFVCHASRYSMQTRIRQMKQLNFKWAGTAAAGIGQVNGSVKDDEIPKVIYNKRLFNENGTFYMPDMVFRPRAKNCLLCHATIDMGKRGTTWDDPINPDVHHLAGLTCIDCHVGDLNHNFTKGNAMAGSVADDLDNTMRSCRDCHTTGYKGATRMNHKSIRKDHLNKLSCEACHIPELNRSAAGAMFVNTGVFGKYGQMDTRRFGEHKSWKPAYVIRKKDKDKIPRITPVNPMLNTLFTNKDKNDKYYPLFLSEVETAYGQCRDQMTQRQVPYDFHDLSDVGIMLKKLITTLDKNHRFTNISPCFHTGGNLYTLDENLSVTVQKDVTWVSQIPYFSISHNVAPIDKALGVNGCADCHSKTAHLFNGRVVTDYFGDKGRPVTVSMAEFLGLSSWVQKLNAVFPLYQRLSLWLFTAVFTGGGIIVLFRGLSPYQSKENSTESKSVIQLMIFGGIFAAGHVLWVKEWGAITFLFKGIMTASPILGPLLMAGSFMGYIFFVQKTVWNKTVKIGMILVGTFIAITGVSLWVAVLGPGTFFLLTGLNAILATGIALIILYLFVRKLF